MSKRQVARAVTTLASSSSRCSNVVESQQSWATALSSHSQKSVTEQLSAVKNVYKIAQPFTRSQAVVSAQQNDVVPAPPIVMNIYGAVSQVLGDEPQQAATKYKNVDGYRIDDGRYTMFLKDISDFIPQSRTITDEVRTFAYGTDASFYRLNPKAVIKISSEEEIQKILPIAHKHNVPVTFRAAGTSLSGQALTDSVLLKISHNGSSFRNYKIHDDGSSITVQPGLIGGEVNRLLAQYAKKNKQPIQYKIGPDPASIDSCMIGGIVNNNSSGMCCGVAQNTYHTIKDLRIIFRDGFLLDTSSQESRSQFLLEHADLAAGVSELAARVQADPQLSATIKRKFAIKCTTGYSLNALVDYPPSDPIEVIKHLLVGSEGTLAFISQATYHTVPEWPNKASAFVMFPTVEAACNAATVLRNNTTVDAVEIFDHQSLVQIQRNERMTELCPDVHKIQPGAASLLIECRGRDEETLDKNINTVTAALHESGLPTGPSESSCKDVFAYPFKKDPKDYSVYWDVRKGLIPIVGGSREPGTSMFIEDVACPIENLAGMTTDLIEMFDKYGYKDAACFGHALEGNLHLVFSQGFRSTAEVQQFGDMMEEMCRIVAVKHKGSCKAEHGTGRNVAPFVEMEWGKKATDVMWEIKDLFDPHQLLNPGVVLNPDANVHVKHLKGSPPADELVNRCIECGFCESNCPSKDLSLTPRQRITVFKEIFRLENKKDKTQAEEQRLKAMSQDYSYLGDATCAADGMCQMKCPVGINTGDLVKKMRKQRLDKWQSATNVAAITARNFSVLSTSVPHVLNLAALMYRVVGAPPLAALTRGLNMVTGHYFPVWNQYMPTGAAPLQQPLEPVQVASSTRTIPRKVVYVPTCVTRMMGPSPAATLAGEKQPVHAKLLSIFSKAGYEVVYPNNLASHCCGMLFDTRGFKDASMAKGAELEDAIMEASEGGKLPVVIDTSPCLAQIKAQLQNQGLKFSLYEPVEFIATHCVDKLDWQEVRDHVAVHVPCSSKKMGLEAKFLDLAGKCAKEVTGTGIPCCGMAGDRGMRYTELTGSSLQHLKLPKDVSDGYSTSRTCEMSLSNHSGVDFKGIVYLVDEATSPKKQTVNA